ncbi:MAG TPA: hypothetical protein VGD98_04610 [Ktedonobacteraceae bacterium]
MIRLGKFSAITVLSLALSLALFTTSVFAQSASQSIDHGNISVSAHAAVLKTAVQGAAKALLENALIRPSGANDDCGNWGWGDGCRGFGGCGDDDCFRSGPTSHCTSERECRTVKTCRWTHGVRVCRGQHVCRFRSASRRGCGGGCGGGGRWAAGGNGWGGGGNGWGGGGNGWGGGGGNGWGGGGNGWGGGGNGWGGGGNGPWSVKSH